MKPFHKKLIVLSLSAIVLAGSGCERRGRAPTQKNTDQTGAATPTVKGDDLGAGAQKKGATEVETKTETKTEEKRVSLEIPADEAELIKAADMSCSASISMEEKSSVDTFRKDFGTIDKLRTCMSDAAGLAFDCATVTGKSCKGSDEEKIWTINSKVLNAQFRTLAERNKMNDEIAEFTLESRLKFFRITAEKMLVKYGPGRIDQNSSFERGVEEKPITVLGINSDLTQMKNRVSDAEKDVKKMTTVSDGELLSQPAAKVAPTEKSENDLAGE